MSLVFLVLSNNKLLVFPYFCSKKKHEKPTLLTFAYWLELPLHISFVNVPPCPSFHFTSLPSNQNALFNCIACQFPIIVLCNIFHSSFNLERVVPNVFVKSNENSVYELRVEWKLHPNYSLQDIGWSLRCK